MANRSGSSIIAPRATALWLIKNTTLTFQQIADFCSLSEMTIKLMADGVIDANLMPVNPIMNGTLTEEEIKIREKDGKTLSAKQSVYEELGIKVKKPKKHLSISQKRSRPEAVIYLLKYYPELKNSQIKKLASTTENIVESIRNKTFKNIQDLVAKDPVLLGLCTQSQIEEQVKKASSIDKKGEKKKVATKKVRKINVNSTRRTKKIEK